ncbi:uncharacterized protein ARMOST_18426 [Armillaria ostoyae]|uniref:Heterokaryon incompatibility domain-containing protein n=1 Tax=Armillaria ostoyae TaxID=47428 RepID=A0A284S1Q9_ARMOS|nr:uncharacterized protein ARMOST_18426 [Armillaria ostoyae]
MDGEEWRRHYEYVSWPRDRGEKAHRHYESLPEVTISAFTETGQAEASVSLDFWRLNAILGASHTLYGPRIYSLLEVFLTQDLDFGTAYAHLRPFWYHDLTDVKDELRIREERDSMMREDVLVKKRIIDKAVPPRRVWDLYSNRVVPWWVARQCAWAISHAWVEEKDRGNVLTPINGFEWPVPIPKDTNLDLIRIEMLNAGAEYAWLDVLCLRQVDGKREDLRAKEWKVDVPTIGWAYSGPARSEPIV